MCVWCETHLTRVEQHVISISSFLSLTIVECNVIFQTFEDDVIFHVSHELNTLSLLFPHHFMTRTEYHVPPHTLPATALRIADYPPHTPAPPPTP